MRKNLFTGVVFLGIIQLTIKFILFNVCRVTYNIHIFNSVTVNYLYFFL